MSAEEDLTRRGAFTTLLGAVLGAEPARTCSGAPENGAAKGTSAEGKPARWGMAIDLDLCTGCGGCVVACRSENNVPMTGHDPEEHGTDIYWMDLLPKQDPRDNVGPVDLLPMPCMHCDDPPCVKVCPVNATYLNDEGLVAQVWDRCIGCRYCMVACPYSRRYFNWKEPEWPDTYRNLLNPDVATRPEGVVEKCTFCHHRIRKLRESARVEGRDVTDADVQRLPACSQSCPANAIVFGDLNDDASWVARLFESPRATKLLEHAGTKPKVVYLGKERRQDP
jgi:molybdopterin-containing oxidoreductase family iron-sulfur binding subunit